MVPIYSALDRWAGSPKDAREWACLIARLAASAQDKHSESRHPAFRDVDPYCKANLLNAHVVETLTKMGVTSPEAFPAEVRSSWDTKEFTPAVFASPYAKTIGNIFFVLNALWAFYVAHVRCAADDSGDSVFAAQMCIEAGMLDLAATMIEVDEAFAPNMPKLRYEVRANYKKWLTVIKYAAPFIGKEFQVSWMMNMIGLENDPSMAVMRSFEPYLETATA